MENQLICSYVNFYILTEGYTVCFAWTHCSIERLYLIPVILSLISKRMILILFEWKKEIDRVGGTLMSMLWETF